MQDQASPAGPILVTGASGGVGQELVIQLLGRGYEVLGSVLNEAEVGSLADRLQGATLFVADFSQAEIGAAQIKAALDGINRPLSAAISCVGVNPCGPLETTPINLLRSTFEINAVSGLALYQATIPHLRRSSGRMILVSSVSGKMALPLLGHYTASKFALEGLADTMRLEAGQWGVPVSLIEPGAIATNMVRGFSQMLAERLDELTEETRVLYADYFAQQRDFAMSPEASPLSPGDVAASIVGVLETAKPEARYPLGTAETFLDARRVSSDSEMDAIVNGVLPGSRSTVAAGE